MRANFNDGPRSGWVSHFWFLKIYPQNYKFFNFYTLGDQAWGQKIPGPKLGQPHIYCGEQKYARVVLDHGPSLQIVLPV